MSAWAEGGFTQNVQSSSGYEVVVSFQGNGQNYTLRIVCRNGQPSLSNNDD